MLEFLSLFGVTWDASFEATPAGTDDPGEGDDRIRELKAEIGDRCDQEHVWMGTASTAATVHKEGSGRVYYSASAPTLRPDGATSLGASDDGRIWCDSDTKLLQVWNGSAFADIKCNGAYDDFAVPGDLTVTGTSTLTGDVNIIGSLDVDTDLNIDGTLTVTGTFTATQIQDQGGGNPLLYTVVSTGAWNMDSTVSITVDLGVNSILWRGIEVMLRTDLAASYIPVLNSQLEAVPSGTFNGPDVYVSALSGGSSIVLVRRTGSYWDSAFADNTSFSRGYIILRYTTA